MSIASAISNAQQRVANAYTSVSTMGGTLPATQDLSHLPAAIESIPGGDEVTISGSSVPSGQRVLIAFEDRGVDLGEDLIHHIAVPYITQYFNLYTYTAISNGDTTFKTALPSPLPYQANYTKTGSPTIDNYYLATNWSSSNYIDTGITLDYYSGNWEWIAKAHCDGSNNACVIGANYITSKFYWYDGSWRTSGSTSKHLTSTSDYWIRMRCVDGVLMGYFLQDNGLYTPETLPPLSSWSGSSVKSYQSAYTGNITIGSYLTTSNRTGYMIDLSSIRIYNINTTNNTKTLIWQMLKPFDNTPIADETTGVRPSGDWVVNGAVPLDYRWGYFNSFSSSTYIKAKAFRWNLATAKSIYIKGHIKTQSSSWSSSTNYPVLCYTTNTYTNPVTVYVNGANQYLSGTFGVIIPSIAVNTEYWFEATMDNEGNQTQKYSTDGENWTETTSTTTAPTWTDYTDVPCVGYWGNANFYWRGSIYDVECGYIDANDETHAFKLWK